MNYKHMKNKLINVGLFLVIVAFSVLGFYNTTSAANFTTTFSCSSTGQPQLLLDWDFTAASTQNSSVAIDRDGVQIYGVIGETSGSFLDTGLAESTTYTYTVRLVPFSGPPPSPNSYTYQATTGYCTAGITVNVVPNTVSGAEWTINPGGQTGSGASSFHTVTPDLSSGTMYVLTVDTVPLGYTVQSVTNSDGGGSSMLVNVTNNKSFDINFIPAPGPTVDIDCDDGGGRIEGPCSVNSGGSAGLIWDSQNANQCSASSVPTGWSGSKGLTGSESTGPLYNSTTFTITCQDTSTGQGDSDSVTVNVIPLGAPLSPTGFTASPEACGTGEITLSWNASTGATSYQLYRNGTQIYDGANTSYTDSGLTDGVSYSYTVVASNTSGLSAPAGPLNAVAPFSCGAGTPPVPTGLTATPGACGTGRISLSWNASTGATSYQLYRNGTQIYSGGSTSYVDTGLTARTLYSYTVRATNSSGQQSGPSSTASATAPMSTCAPTTMLWYDPTGSTPYPGFVTQNYTITYGTPVTLKWDVSGTVATACGANSTNFGSWTGQNWSGLVAIPPPVQSRLVGTAPNLTVTTTFTLTCTNSSGGTANKITFNVVPPVAATLPAVPTNLTAIPGACGTATINLSWNASTGATSYQLYRDGNATSTYNGANTGFSDVRLTAGTSYSYTVKATNSIGSSAQSSPVNTTAPSACPANQPAVVQFTKPTSGATLSGTLVQGDVNALAYDPDIGTTDGAGIDHVRFQFRQGATIINYVDEWTKPYDYPSASGLDTTTLSNGSYTIRAIAYSTAAAGGGSNYADLPVNISNGVAPQPDLTAGGVTPTSATVGTAVTLTASISNIGTAGTGASFSNFFQICSVPGGCAVPTDLSATTMSALANGASANTTRSYTFPSATTYSARACADKTSSAGGGVIDEGINEGNNCGAWTDVTVNPAATPPAKPTGLKATPGACGTATINLSWQASAGATSYNLYRTPGGEISVGNVQTYANTGLTAGGNYSYQVKAFNSAGNSGWTVPPVPATAPSACIVASPLPVSCSVSPSPAKVGDTVVWTVSGYSSGTAPFTFAWSGTDITGTIVTSVNTLNKIYQTTGLKNIDVTVTDNVGATGSCPSTYVPGQNQVQVKVNPNFGEF
jgi:hypothetical protein